MAATEMIDFWLFGYINNSKLVPQFSRFGNTILKNFFSLAPILYFKITLKTRNRTVQIGQNFKIMLYTCSYFSNSNNETIQKMKKF